MPAAPASGDPASGDPAGAWPIAPDRDLAKLPGILARHAARGLSSSKVLFRP
jgi:hypothetical protein